MMTEWHVSVGLSQAPGVYRLDLWFEASHVGVELFGTLEQFEWLSSAIAQEVQAQRRRDALSRG